MRPEKATLSIPRRLMRVNVPLVTTSGHLLARRSPRVAAMQRLPRRRPEARWVMTILTVAASDNVKLNVVPFLCLLALAARPDVGVDRPPTTKTLLVSR